MRRKIVVLAILAALTLSAQTSRLVAYNCQNNPGCLCYDATYTGGDSCRRTTFYDCIIIIC